MKLDPSILARIQFAFAVSFHIIVPTMSIGLASFLAVIEALWLKTKNPTYLQIYRFWLNIFAMGKSWGENPKYIGRIFHDFRRSAAHEVWKAGKLAVRWTIA
jgi:Cytochrome bd terminal oxidase subunit I